MTCYMKYVNLHYALVLCTYFKQNHNFLIDIILLTIYSLKEEINLDEINCGKEIKSKGQQVVE